MVFLIPAVLLFMGLHFFLKTGMAGIGRGGVVEREKDPFTFWVACFLVVVIGVCCLIVALAEILHR